MKNKGKIGLMSGIIVVLFIVVGVTYAFFNYTRIGQNNTISVGRISFNHEQTNTISLTNVFPISSNDVGTDTTNVGTVTITITGDTTYDEGIEYLLTVANLTNTVNNKKMPISVLISANNTGALDSDYFSNRGDNTSIYKVLDSGVIKNNQQLLVGYIAKGETGVNGTITIKAYMDKDKIAISDTYDGEESDNMGTTVDWVDDRVVFTTTEWNSLQNQAISFQVKVEANEGIWVKESVNLANKIKGRLGQDGVVAVNTNGDLYTGSGTIREYRYSGIGNYCTYADGTNNYNLSVEGTDCPENAYKGSNGYIFLGDTDGVVLYGFDNETELTRVNLTATDSGLKNYIMFNNEKWRIIGVFGDNIKIIKDLPLTKNLTNNPIDTVGIDGNTPNENSTYTNLNNETYFIKKVNNASTLKYGYFYYNYPAYSDLYANNYDAWNDWNHSGIMNYLNEDNTGSYYSTIDTRYKDLIDNTTYYLGNITIGSFNGWYGIDGIAKEIYEQEHGNIECNENVAYDTQNSNCNIWYRNSATWTGKIGLIYPSDYAYASSSGNWNTNVGNYYHNGGSFNNWINNTYSGINWTISPAASGNFNVICIGSTGDIADRSSFYASAVRPSLYLVSDVETIAGDGSYNNPYILNVE